MVNDYQQLMDGTNDALSQKVFFRTKLEEVFFLYADRVELEERSWNLGYPGIKKKGRSLWIYCCNAITRMAKDMSKSNGRRPHDDEDFWGICLQAVFILLRNDIREQRVKNLLATVNFKDSGGPTFQVRPSGFLWRPKNPDGSKPTYGCHISFHCPMCGKMNAHGGDYRNKGGGDGHRNSHCSCWPSGYMLQEI